MQHSTPKVEGMGRELEADGLWENATIVLTSDHWQRLAADPAQGVSPEEPGVEASQRRVPLLIKWPGVKGHLVVSTPVNAAGAVPFLASPEASRTLDQLQIPTGPMGAYNAWIK